MTGTKLSPFRYHRDHDSTAVFDHARAKRHIIFVFKNSDEGTVHLTNLHESFMAQF